MSIHNKRLNQITEGILQDSLQRGILPDSKEFIWRLNMAMRDQKLSQPKYKFKPYRTTEIISSGRINKDNNSIHDDLSILYDNIIDVHKLLNKYQSNFEVEKEKLATEISSIENELKQKIMSYNSSGYLAYAYDTFDELSKVDKKVSSDIFVDTKEKQVRLVEEKNTSSRIYPDAKTQFSIAESILDKKDAVLTGSLQDVLKDNSDTVWQKQYILKENRSLTGLVEIQFDKSYTVNKIDIDFMSIKRFFAKVEFTNDGYSWYEIPYNQEKVEVKDSYSVQFPSMNMKAVRIIMDKIESDEILPATDSYNFMYLFGLKKVQFYNKQYPSKGLFQSEPLSLKNASENYRIDKVRLSVNEVVPTGTSIRYEVALPQEDDNYDWHPLDPIERINPTEPQTLQFSNIKRNESLKMFFPSEYSIVQSEAEGLVTNGIPIYRLSTNTGNKVTQYIPDKAIIDGSLKLYTGRDSWEISSFPSKDVDSIPSIEDWKKVHDGTKLRYSLMNNSKSGDVLKGWTDEQTGKYLCKAGFYNESNDIIISTAPISSDPFALFVNGDIIFEGSPGEKKTVNIAFKTGWNEIAIFINGKNATSAAGMNFSLGFNPQSLATYSYSSSKPLQEIPLFDLKYNTKQNDHSVFSTRKTSEGIEILTNFALPGLPFDLYYDYADELALDKEPAMLIRAYLERENGENIPSPVIKSYRLEFS
ncbi:hypothetical protein ACFC9N_11435 [Enterococcus casseliflavus]|uniref:hypothetical protein n=1 Tax=Enterococcus TaxID=1350 RepID=UPI000A3AC153|nr:hypothetical protein [Enterococcus sp. 4E1_DIV0656]OTO09299.1 hypothetical protein A5882_003632 [Enterococcus sp. 4E1_DIV0656]